MQKKAGKNNKKQLSAVQNLIGDECSKTPQRENKSKSRAKFDCSQELSKLIFIANLLPKEIHFDLMETSKIKIEGIEHLKPAQIDFDETTDVDKIIRRSKIYMAKMHYWEKMFEMCFDHRANWAEFYLSLPKEVGKYLYESEEIIQFRKSDSYEYWLNNDGEAWDQLEDLHNGEEITNEEYDHIQINGDIADFLVEKGYYGEKWSYLRQKNLEEDQGNYRENNNNFYFSEYFALYRAYRRFEETRDFIYGILNLAEYLKEKKGNFRLDLLDHLPKALVEEVIATDIKINEQGEVSFSISRWARAIQGVDISRIRRCEVCRKIFWASRKDAFACSPKHAKVRQMRLLRANWKDKETIYISARKRKAKKKKENK